jgi:hypothetical protein
MDALQEVFCLSFIRWVNQDIISSAIWQSSFHSHWGLPGVLHHSIKLRTSTPGYTAPTEVWFPLNRKVSSSKHVAYIHLQETT